MTILARDPLYRRHRFPAEVIAHAVWLYFRFPLSLRMVEDMPAARGIIVSHQTVKLWAEKFGRHFANDIRRRSAGKLGDKWHLDEVVITIAGKKHWPWRAVDQDGFVLDVLVQRHRNAKAAKRLMRKLLKGQGRSPRVMITDRQAAILRRSKARDHAGCRASLPQRVEQSGGEDHEALQVSETSPALRLHPRSDRQPVSHSSPRHFIRLPSPTAGSGDPDVEPARPSSGSLMTDLNATPPIQADKFTMPRRHMRVCMTSLTHIVRSMMRERDIAGCL
jgi:putative transposase